MWVSKYFVFFLVYSVLGWVYESIYCTIEHGKWQNRGFLYGPACPIYGTGGAAITAIVDALHRHDMNYTWWQIFLISVIGSAILEYVTSWALEKRFHAYWWDYSKLPFNINGRICLSCSLGFGVAGLVVVYGVAPLTHKMLDPIPPIAMEFLSLLGMAFITVDLTMTVAALSNFERTIIALQDGLNEHMDNFVANIQDKTQEAGSVIADERARFSKENLENAFAAMGVLSKAGIKRVMGFRRRDVEEQNRFNIVFESLKKYVPKRKNKKV